MKRMGDLFTEVHRLLPVIVSELVKVFGFIVIGIGKEGRLLVFVIPKVVSGLGGVQFPTNKKTHFLLKPGSYFRGASENLAFSGILFQEPSSFSLIGSQGPPSCILLLLFRRETHSDNWYQTSPKSSGTRYFIIYVSPGDSTLRPARRITMHRRGICA